MGSKGRKSVLWLLLAANIIGGVGFLLWSGRDGGPECAWITPIATPARWFCPEGVDPPGAPP
jgi:hypothetical protein